MLLSDVIKYAKQYEEGIKKITYSSRYLKIQRDPIDYKFIKSHGNYVLFFDRKGRLHESLHNEKDSPYKIIYGYNIKGWLITVINLRLSDHKVISQSEFEYDEKGRIIKEIVRPLIKPYENDIAEEHIHCYSDNNQTILITNYQDIEGEIFIEELTQYLTYDNIGRVIEDKIIKEDDELINWEKFEYNEQNHLIKEMTLDENGKQDGLIEFFPYHNNLSTGYQYTNEKDSYTKEYKYTFNDKGHWINQIHITNGEPINLYERNIEYF